MVEEAVVEVALRIKAVNVPTPDILFPDPVRFPPKAGAESAETLAIPDPPVPPRIQTP